MTLVRVEEAFRTLKQDLHLRPICHHWEHRTEAHVLFAWTAYALYWVLERTHRRPLPAGLFAGAKARTLSCRTWSSSQRSSGRSSIMWGSRTQHPASRPR